MKLLVLVLALAMYQITSAEKNVDYGREEENTWGCEEEQTWENSEENSFDGSWITVDPQDAENDQEVQDALNFGIQELVKRAIASRELPEDSYSLLRITSVQEQVVSGMNYRFDVTLSSTDGLGVIVTFDVYSVIWEGTQELTSYFILGIGWENNQDDTFNKRWTLMDPQDAENDQEVQDALNFGVQELVKRAIASGELPDGSYSLDVVFRIQKQNVSEMNYLFDVSLLSTDGVYVSVTFKVYSQSWMSTQELTSYFIFAVRSAEENSS